MTERIHFSWMGYSYETEEDLRKAILDWMYECDEIAEETIGDSSGNTYRIVDITLQKE